MNHVQAWHPVCSGDEATVEGGDTEEGEPLRAAQPTDAVQFRLDSITPECSSRARSWSSDMVGSSSRAIVASRMAPRMAPPWSANSCSCSSTAESADSVCP